MEVRSNSGLLEKNYALRNTKFWLLEYQLLFEDPVGYHPGLL
jgi:hypothetical protein